MKKQYDYYETRWPYHEVVLYHDGAKVVVERKSLLELDDYLEQLENDGYTRGYTEDTLSYIFPFFNIFLIVFDKK